MIIETILGAAEELAKRAFGKKKSPETQQPGLDKPAVSQKGFKKKNPPLIRPLDKANELPDMNKKIDIDGHSLN